MNWPVPLTARPSVQILRDAGVEWEQAKLADIEAAFGERARFDKQGGKYREVALQPILQQHLTSPAFILQPSFAHPMLKEAFLQSIGADQAQIAHAPPFGTFRPDIISVHTRLDDEVAM